MQSLEVKKPKIHPFFFNLNGIPVELYFSPSDKTTQKIVSKLEQAKEEQLLALMIFTNWELRDQVAENLRDDIRTRWIVEDVEFSQSVINLVRNLNGTVRQHIEPEIFHHKYAILDENTNQPVLITGSHNWTYAAETVNDENTLIFYDKRIANIFRQEFEARWKDILTSTGNQAVYDKVKIFPNPSSGLISFSKPLKNVCILNNLGSPVLCYGHEVQQIFLDLPSGIYFLLHEEGSEKIFITR
jgi:phosphatidylserine/phosphatidylglycerophosphate/cardiolipin synthase-like enzyme